MSKRINEFALISVETFLGIKDETLALHPELVPFAGGIDRAEYLGFESARDFAARKIKQYDSLKLRGAQRRGPKSKGLPQPSSELPRSNNPSLAESDNGRENKIHDEVQDNRGSRMPLSRTAPLSKGKASNL